MEIQTSYFSCDLLLIDVKMSRVASESRQPLFGRKRGRGEKIKRVKRNMSCTSKWVIFTLNFNTGTPLRRMAKLMRVPGVIRIIDWLRRREAGSDVAGLDCSTVNIPSSLDNYSIRTRIYRPPNVAEPLPCLLLSWWWVHHGRTRGIAELIKLFIQTRPCVVVAPDYRKAHQKPFPVVFRIVMTH